MDSDDAGSTMSRRAAIGLGAAVIAGAALGTDAGSGAAGATTATGARTDDGAETDLAGDDVLARLRPDVRPRDAWGADLAVTGEIRPEDDVRFLLVHHTASTNDYQPEEVVDQIRGFHRFHTGPDKGWPDVAYNFFIDRFGGIWEARAGSIDGPVRGDATGGSQGFALLCCLIGNHAEAPVTDAARTSLIALLAWLAERHGLDTSPGTTIEFTSRGSNRWPTGAPVVATTIAGHRDMSQTACPGDFAYGLIAEDLPAAVTARRLEAVAATRAATSTTTPKATLVEATTTSTTPAPSSTADASAAAIGSTGGPADNTSPLDDVGGTGAVLAGGAAAAALALAAARRRATRSIDD